MVDTWSVSDNQRWSRICFSFTDSFQSLSLVSTHSDLCNIYITVSSSHQTEVFLTYALTSSSELSDSTYRSSFRRLTTCVRVNFSIQNEDVNVLTGSDYMVKTTITDIVRSTVTTNDPLAAFYKILLQFSDLFAVVTFILVSFNNRNDLSSQFLSLVRIQHIVDPFSEQFFHFSRSAISSNSLVHHFHEASTHLFVSQFHTQTEFTEVFEQ